MSPTNGDTPERERLAGAFAKVAGLYEQGRPGYPDGVLDLLADELGVHRGTTVLDLGAGTGKLTRRLLELTDDVIAVEPLAEMRAELARVLPTVHAVAGSAEAIPLDDGSVDVVTVAQAFHWFDGPAALAEIARVLRPGGWVMLVWNELDRRRPPIDVLVRVLREATLRPPTIEHDWRAELDESGLFEPARRGRWRWQAPISHAAAIAAVESRSYVAALGDAERSALLAEVAALIAAWPDPFDQPFATEAHWCQRPIDMTHC